MESPKSLIKAYIVTTEILRKLDDLRVKCMDEGNPVNGVLDCIQIVHISQYPILDGIERSEEAQMAYYDVFGEKW